MGMTTHVFGIKPPDDRWVKMKAIWDACEEAGVAVPAKVSDFFDGEAPDEVGVIVKLTDCVREWSEEEEGDCDGLEVDLKELPPEVTVIRFYNSY